jgi:4-amino-4-deoxy-L-arabinose transferase-like glycosyltransferase
MKLANVAENLWGQRAKFSYLLIASAILLFTLLGARDLWTQEHRWADIVSGMFFRRDFLHPYLGENDYYDKPLLSYWLIALVAKLTGELTTWALRLPSALAGMLAIWSIYSLGSRLKDKSLGMLSGWLLLTTFYFIFWARTSSADMLNMAGSLFAVAWYFQKRDKAKFFDYAVFFMIIALTSLCKGLVGAIVPIIAVMTDIVLQKSWKQNLRFSVFFAAIPALIVYVLPFWASSYFGGDSYGESGLYLVYRENILRYFQPFDHQGPIYTYFLYLPIYLLPWAVFFIPALFSLRSRWRTLPISSKWIAWTLFALFVFFTLSGSRRSYYVLPMVPFAILFTADWMLSGAVNAKRRLWSAGLVAASFILLLFMLDVLPAWYYSQVGIGRFAATLKAEASKVKPWGNWNVVMLDAESKLNFYLQLPPTTHNYQIKGSTRDLQTAASLVQSWPMIKNKPANTIFVTRKLYLPLLQSYFNGYRIVKLPSQSHLPFISKHDTNIPIAFIPLS